MRIKHHAIYCAILLLVLTCSGCRIKEEEPKIVFQDQTFQAVFDKNEYTQDYKIIPPTQSQLNQMTSLYLDFLEGEECSLEDLKKFPDLRTLYIDGASESVIRQVSEQKQLKALWFRTFKSVDMSSLGAMDHIEALAIEAPGVEAGELDWSFIEDMERLETLYIRFIESNDLNFLKNLSNLERLVIHNVEIKDISALELLSNLKYLKISGDSTNDYSEVLKSMNHLEQLSIRGVKLKDLNFVRDTPNLERLQIYDVKAEDISALEALSNLKLLSINEDNRNDYATVLESMNQLEGLVIDTVGISDWGFLKNMKNLDELSIRNMGNVNLSSWLLPENLPNLKELSVDDDISNTNQEMMEQILPIIEKRAEERGGENDSKSEFSDRRLYALKSLEKSKRQVSGRSQYIYPNTIQ